MNEIEYYKIRRKNKFKIFMVSYPLKVNIIAEGVYTLFH